MSKVATLEYGLTERVQVRLTEYHEGAEFERRVDQVHYLHRTEFAGPNLRYLPSPPTHPLPQRGGQKRLNLSGTVG
jgi:hypothetical protein